MDAPEDDQKVPSFGHFPELATELRMMITDKMGPDDRCRYGGSSLLSNKVAKTSKNYIHSLTYHVRSMTHITIDVRHGDLDVYGETGYILDFVVEFGHMYMIYKNRKDQQLWWTTLTHSEMLNPRELERKASQKFKKLLTSHQQQIRALSIKWELPSIKMNIDFGITRMNRLEELKLEGNFDHSQLISITPRVLKKLAISKNTYFQTPLEKIFQVQNFVSYKHLKLNNEQFLQMTASIVHIHIGQLTVEDVVNFIRSWQNGTIRRNVREVVWTLIASSFEVTRLFATFGYEIHRYFKHGATMEIEHFHDEGKIAELKFVVEELQVFFRDE